MPTTCCGCRTGSSARCAGRAPRGHTLVLGPIGLENFSAAENARLNKGIDQDQARRAARLIDSWLRDFPDAVAQENRFGFILFTPWTTLDDLVTNLDGARALGIDPRFFLRRRLVFLTDSPLQRLAERDGLLDPRDAASLRRFERFRASDPGCRHFPDEQDRPWRFRDPVVGAVCEIAFRMAGSDLPLPRDPIDDRIAAGLASADWGDRLFDAFAVLLDAAREPGAPCATEDLVDRFVARLPVHVPEPGEAADDGEDPRFRAVRARFRRLARTDPSVMRGFALREVRLAEAAPGLTLTFTRGDDDFVVHAAPASIAPPEWTRRGEVAVCTDRSTPLATADHALVLSLAAAVLGTTARGGE